VLRGDVAHRFFNVVELFAKEVDLVETPVDGSMLLLMLANWARMVFSLVSASDSVVVSLG
jgi:hypothetical protein